MLVRTIGKRFGATRASSSVSKALVQGQFCCQHGERERGHARKRREGIGMRDNVWRGERGRGGT